MLNASRLGAGAPIQVYGCACQGNDLARHPAGSLQLYHRDTWRAKEDWFVGAALRGRPISRLQLSKDVTNSTRGGHGVPPLQDGSWQRRLHQLRLAELDQIQQDILNRPTLEQ